MVFLHDEPVFEKKRNEFVVIGVIFKGGGQNNTTSLNLKIIWTQRARWLTRKNKQMDTTQ